MRDYCHHIVLFKGYEKEYFRISLCNKALGKSYGLQTNNLKEIMNTIFPWMAIMTGHIIIDCHIGIQ